MADAPKKLTFKYVYPENLSDLYVNGVYGGVTPRKEIYAHFYSERLPIPKKIVHEITENGTLGHETDREAGGDVVRLIQASLVMDLRTATAIRDWLNDRIAYMERLSEK